MSERNQDIMVIAGVDTHKDTHTAAVINSLGLHLGTETFPATVGGYRALLSWVKSFGALSRFGVEGTSSYGAGLTRHLLARGVQVVEVVRPSRQTRRRNGKSDPIDAQEAARSALAQTQLGAPKTQDGRVEMIRMLRLQRRSAVKAKSQAANQIHALVSTASDSLKESLMPLTLKKLVKKASLFRVAEPNDLESTAKFTLRGLARRWLMLHTEVLALNKELTKLVESAAPELLKLHGVATETAAILLVAAGDNPERLKSEASFAALCGVSPVDASSGRQHRHRINRGGNRDANRALWVIALVRFRTDPRTLEYTRRRLEQGMSKKEIIRCLKRYIAREVFKILRPKMPDKAANPEQMPALEAACLAA
jgi:transposase